MASSPKFFPFAIDRVAVNIVPAMSPTTTALITERAMFANQRGRLEAVSSREGKILSRIKNDKSPKIKKKALMTVREGISLTLNSQVFE